MFKLTKTKIQREAHNVSHKLLNPTSTRSIRQLVCRGLKSFLLALLLSLIGNHPAGAASPVLIDSQKVGRTFEGIGTISAGASSRLLIDYPEPQRSRILDYLFKPNYGAALQHLKVEIGGDINSTDGTEPSHMRTRDEENYHRGYEWWLMKEAKKRNPKLYLDALQWGTPGWIGNFYSQENADYIVKFIQGAKRVHKLDIDYTGIWNETRYDIAWIKLLRRTLNEAGLQNVKIVASDNDGEEKWRIVDSALQDRELYDSIHAVGAHYPVFESPKEARESGKPIWSSEDGPWRGDWEGARKLAMMYNRNYVLGRMTKTEIWSPVTSYYDSLPLSRSGLMLANEPWSGHFEIQPAIWATAHTTQFAHPGWNYLDSACVMIDGGSIVALKSPDGDDYSLIIETMDAKTPQEVVFTITNLPSKQLHAWRTTEQQQFVKDKKIKTKDGTFALRLEPQTLYSLTTTKGQAKKRGSSPRSKPFPFPYRDSFESYSAGTTPRYFSDQAGAFEIVKRADEQGHALRQVILQKGIEWRYHYDPNPETFLGALDWTDYEVSVNVMLENTGYASLFGRVARVPQMPTPPDGYWLRIRDTGEWELCVLINPKKGENKYTQQAILGSGKADLAIGTWHRLALRFSGETIGVLIDNQPLAEFTDTTFAAGMVGIGCGWHGAQFDDFAVSPLTSQ